MTARDSGQVSLGLAFVIGGLLGAAAILLSTPESGDETRERLRQYVDEVWGRTRHAARNAADQGRGLLSGTVAPFNAAYRAGREAYRSESLRLNRIATERDIATGATSHRPM